MTSNRRSEPAVSKPRRSTSCGIVKRGCEYSQAAKRATDTLEHAVRCIARARFRCADGRFDRRGLIGGEESYRAVAPTEPPHRTATFGAGTITGVCETAFLRNSDIPASGMPGAV